MRLYIAIRLNYGFQGFRKTVKRKGKPVGCLYAETLCGVPVEPPGNSDLF